MKESVLRRTWAEIDLNAIAENYRQVRKAAANNAKLCCVIKADAYGHGSVRVAKELEKLGADCFGISNLEEAMQLRQNGIKIPLLILGYTPAEHAKTLAGYDITQCVYSLEYARQLSHYAAESRVQVRCHLKVDTGMNRLGIAAGVVTGENTAQCTETRGIGGVIQEILEICSLPGLDFTGIFTHFAVSDEGEAGQEFTKRQYDIFMAVLDGLEKEGKTFQTRHCANSGAILDYPYMHLDMVRAGIILYGLYPSGKIQNKPPLIPALSLKSVVSHVKKIHKGDTVSYGRIFKAEKDVFVATVPIGYADGYPRILGECRADAAVGGQRCHITGRVCMDQLVVDVTGVPNVKIGDEVTLIGKQGDAVITADELAEYENSINYEVICDIGKRVPRVYMRGKEMESVLNLYADFL